MNLSDEKNKVYSILVFLYIISIGFQSLLRLPYFGLKLQVSEICFLFLLAFFAYDFFKNKNSLNLRFSSFDKLLFLYPSVVFISCIVNGGFHTWLELAGVLYLYILYFIVKSTLSKYDLYQIYELAFTAFLWGGFLLAISGLIGWGILYFFETPNSVVFVYEDYPYFGDVIRVHGFTPSPHMMASILNISILFFFSNIFFQKQLRGYQYLFFAVILVAYALTLAKIVVLLFLAILLLFFNSRKSGFFLKTKKVFFPIFSILMIIFYLFATHFIVVKKEDSSFEKIKEAQFNVGYAIAKTKNHLLIPTTYAALKKSAFLMGKRNPVFGVGLGNHEFQLEPMRVEGSFPKHIENNPPHSTYLGAFAELGLIGFSILLMIVFMISKKLIRLKNSHSSPIVLVLCSIFFIAAIEAISTDILNFRQYWIILGLLAVVLEKEKIG